MKIITLMILSSLSVFAADRANLQIVNGIAFSTAKESLLKLGYNDSGLEMESGSPENELEFLSNDKHTFIFTLNKETKKIQELTLCISDFAPKIHRFYRTYGIDAIAIVNGKVKMTISAGN